MFFKENKINKCCLISEDVCLEHSTLFKAGHYSLSQPPLLANFMYKWLGSCPTLGQKNMNLLEFHRLLKFSSLWWVIFQFQTLEGKRVRILY